MKIKELYEQVRDGNIISDIELQREIVYNVDKQRLVIDSIVNGIPLPAFYFWKNDKGVFEVLDGKQRIFSIKEFIENNIEYNAKIWKLTDRGIQEMINNTDLSIIVCEGTEELKREIFRRINTLGVPLSSYEVLNGLFNGEYLRGLSVYVESDKDAKKVLGANSRGKNQFKILYLICSLKNLKKDAINDYVSKNQDFSFVDDQRLVTKYIKFVGDVFTDYGQLDIYFNLAVKYTKDISLWKGNKIEINSHIKRYLKSDDAKLTDKAKEIEDIIQSIVNNISVDDKRLYTSDDKEELLKDILPQYGKYECGICKQSFFKEELTVDHITAWSKGGRTVLSNAQVLCRACNSKKGNR